MDPGVPIPHETTLLTGLDDATVAGAPRIGTVIREVAEVVGERDCVAHHAAFDRAFVHAAAADAGVHAGGRWLDSLELARIALPRLRSHRLRDIAEAFGLTAEFHRAAGDAEAMFHVWRIALAGLDGMGADVVAELARISPGTAWPLREVLRHLSAAAPARSLDLKAVRAASTRGHQHPGLADAEERELGCPDVDAVLAEFAAEGAVGRMYPGYESRDEQRAMARGVLDAFAAREHLAVEAGTGVGKSVAYLVPAAAFALHNRLGVGVATKTNTLMDQLVHSELPRLSEALGGGLRFVALKGYEHYPCMRKIERRLGEESLPAEDVANLAALVAWVAASSWGDLDAINLHWTPESRRQVACSVEDCTHKRCRYYPTLCYLHGVRRRAGSAHIVVTNHALLFRDRAAAGGILPPLRYWVIDEAHAAESEARKQLSLSADHRTISAMLAALHAEGRGGAVDAVRSKVRAAAFLAGNEDLASRVETLASRLRAEITTTATIAGSFFDFLKDLRGEDEGYDSSEVHITEAVRDTHRLERGGRGRALARATAGGGHGARARPSHGARGGRRRVRGRESRPRRSALTLARPARRPRGGARRRRRVLRLQRRREPTARRSPRHVVGLDARRRVRVGRALLSRRALGASSRPPRWRPATTSRTSPGPSGSTASPSGAWNAMRLESSYDFDRQMAVFVPDDLPEPRGTAHLAALERLLLGVHDAMGGSVLTLFTSKREMELLYDRLSPQLEERGLPLLLQGRGVSNKRVRDEFLAEERLSLFATKSFWEGFDAKGDTLRCVVIARLPFGRVRDPLYEERQQRFGRSAWDDFYLPEAVLELKQAAGRLVRSSTDEGCVIVADGRLTGGKGYARHFLEALPVRDVEVASTDEVVRRVRLRFGRPVPLARGRD